MSWFTCKPTLAVCQGHYFSDHESILDNVPLDCGRDSPLRQEGSDCALQRGVAGLESRWFGRKRTVLQLHRLTEGGIAISVKKEINIDRSCTKRDTSKSTDEGGHMPKSLSIIEARKKLTNIPELFEQEADLDVVAITRRGKPVMAIMPWELYEALEETLEILGDEALMMQLRESIEELKAGQLIPWEETGAGAGR